MLSVEVDIEYVYVLFCYNAYMGGMWDLFI
jgi:hypothetical protein